MNATHILRKLITLIIFSIAMGFLEATVVVYIRELYYPEGFTFPLKLLPEKIFGIELVRELTTLIMLAGAGILAGRTRLERFACFLLAFGIWDIFYYAGLKAFLDWPGSLLTWDVLFLIPVVWLGPVLAPLICAATMVWFALEIILRKNDQVKPGGLSWILIFSGAFLIFCSFIYNYSDLMIQEGVFRSGGPKISDIGFIQAVTSYIPGKFLWWLFIPGELLIISGVLIYSYSQKKRIS